LKKEERRSTTRVCLGALTIPELGSDDVRMFDATKSKIVVADTWEGAQSSPTSIALPLLKLSRDISWRSNGDGAINRLVETSTWG
jgi:hypothetical protein